MKKYLAAAAKAFSFVASCVLVLSILRFIFLLYNHDLFVNPGAIKLTLYWLKGIYFDIPAAVYVTIPVTLLLLLPIGIQNRKWFSKIVSGLFLIIVSIITLVELADMAYFRFNLHRTTFAIITQGHDIAMQFGSYLWRYSFLLLILLVILFFVFVLVKKLNKQLPLLETEIKNLKDFIIQFVVFVISAFVLGILGRGGFQERPLSTMHAAEYAEPQFTPLLTSTTLSLIQSFGRKHLVPHHYFSEAEASQYFTYFKQASFSRISISSKPNVVIIIWESLGKGYSSKLNNGVKGYTPFLDSLMKNSFVCYNAFANSHHSIDGNSSINSSIPSLFGQAIVQSQYQSDDLPGLATYLSQLGYSTSFYHGAINGNFNLDAYSRKAGYKEYYGKNEFPDQSLYDGTWGIWDEPYLQYFAKQLASTREPFLSTVFTVTSHDPYKVPKEYANKLEAGPTDFCKVMQYTDLSLRKFFETAAKMSWYSNTLFIITADHASYHWDAKFNNAIGSYKIPILFYCPSHPLGSGTKRLVSQIDILPSVLNFVGFQGEYSSFGASVFDSLTNRFACYLTGDTYYLIDDSLALQFTNNTATGLFKYKTDEMMQQNLIAQQTKDTLLRSKTMRSIIQHFDEGVVNNTLIRRNVP